jgi:two-component system chemotaxis sensor kinase CheA
MDDLTDAFVAESEEAISELNAGLLELEDDPDDDDAMDSVFRTAHTLKGNAGAMGLPTAADLAHALENLLDGMRRGDVPVTGETMDAAFAGVDEFEAMLSEVAETGGIDRDATETVAEIERVVRETEGVGADASGDPDAGDDAGDDGTAETGDRNDDAGIDSAGVGGEGTAPDSPVDTPAGATGDPGDDFTVPASGQVADDSDTGTDVPTADDGSGSTSAGDPTTDDPGHGLAEPTPEETDALREASAEPDGPARHVRLSVLTGDFPEIDGSLAMDGVAEEVAVLGADPDPSAIREGDFENPVDLLIESDAEPDAVAATLAAVPRIENAVAAAVGDPAADAEAVRRYRAARAADGTDAPTDGDGARVQSVRVDVDTLDTLYGLVEELVTSRIRLRGAVESGDLDAAQQELDALETATGDIQDTVMDARLVPLSTVASTLPRVVRDTARECGKEAILETDGEDVEMDRDVLEAIGDPLIHVVRNAVDHGIEPPAVRESAGKPREGTVELRAWRDRDRVTVEVSDDGAGLDPDALRETAVERGTVAPAEAAAMSDEAARELVFEPGFSTAGEVTEVSGRGVGMDVVASTVRGLDGRVEIESDPGEGTTVRLRLPVSVAIARTLFVEVGDEEFGVPVSAVEEVGRLTETRTVEGREVVPIDDELYPLVRLDDALSVPGDVEGEMIVRARSSVRRVALGVDAVAGQEEVVIKPFDGVLEGVPGLSGATVLGEGRVVPVLDVETL